jgi:hypothetical protein
MSLYSCFQFYPVTLKQILAYKKTNKKTTGLPTLHTVILKQGVTYTSTI